MDVSGYEVDGGLVFAPHLGGELPLVGTTRNEAPNQPLVLIPHITPQGKLSTPTPQKMHYSGEITQNHHRFALFESSQIG